MVRSIISGVVGAAAFGLALLGWQNYDAPASYTSLADSVVRIENSKTGSYGSGVLVAPDKVITAAHVARSSAQGGVAETRDKRVFAIRETALSKDMDIAILTLDRPVPGAKIAPTSCDKPKEDTPLLAIGHPIGARWGAFRFTLAGMIEDKSLPTGSLMMQGPGGPGLSGGPAFTSDGKAVGIVTHSVNYAGKVPSGHTLLLPFSSVCSAKADPVKEAMGW